MTFNDYLIGKKIDREAFQKAEPILFDSWKLEFEQMHPESFTAQKLYLINPVRRKYVLVEVKQPKPTLLDVDVKPIITPVASSTNDSLPGEPNQTSPKPPRPVFKQRPKTS